MISLEEYSKICELIIIEHSRYEVKYASDVSGPIIHTLEDLLNIASIEIEKGGTKSLQIIPVCSINFKNNFEIKVIHKRLMLRNFVFHCSYNRFNNPKINATLAAFWLNPL